MTEREQFEAWAKKAGWPHHFTSCNTKDPNAYSQESWEVWQAARAQAAQEGPVLADNPLFIFAQEVIHGAYKPEELKDAAMRAIRHHSAQPAQAVPVLTDAELRSILQGTNHMVKNSMHGAFWPELEEACRAVEAAVRAKMGVGWQPISTAPKDGTRVMVWMDDKYASNRHAFAKLWFYEDGRLGGGAEGYNGDWGISHWMPLPPPPGIVGKEGGNG